MSSVFLAESPETDTPAGSLARSNSSEWALSPCRRCLDYSVAAVALVCSLPLLLLVAAAGWLSSQGPILFRQRRAGRQGGEFILYKFRSMRVGAAQGAAITVRGDRRITPVGRFLRRFKLDELPQLWNVLRGDMALVGPRPKLPQHEGLNLCWRPGLTGAASLAFRDEEEMLAMIPEEQLDEVYEKYVKPAKARLDSEYMRNATLASDIGILWNTAASCISLWKCAHLFSGEFLERPLSTRNPRFMERSRATSSYSRHPSLRIIATYDNPPNPCDKGSDALVNVCPSICVWPHADGERITG